MSETFMPWNPAPNPERQAFTGELRELLEWAIDGLPDGAREVFVLREVEGLSTAEAAASLDVSEDVIKTRLSRARAALRRSLLERTGRDSTGSLPLLSSPLRPCRRPGACTHRQPAVRELSTLTELPQPSPGRCHLSSVRHSEE